MVSRTFSSDNESVIAGNNGSIFIAYWDKTTKRHRVVVGYVGEDGIEPNVAYIVEAGKLVKKL